MTAVPEQVAARIRRPPEPGHHIMEGSTPVVFFGNQPGARVATLGINPSRGEFAVNAQMLDGDRRRFETLDSLGIESVAEAEDSHVEAIYRRCVNYFRDPETGVAPRATAYWTEWFRHLEDIIKPLADASYLDGTACHLDLVQWATSPLWGDLSRGVRQSLLSQDEDFLKWQLSADQLDIVYLNGRSVCDQFISVFPEAPLTKHVLPTPGTDNSSTTFFRGWYRNTKIVGASYNIQRGGSRWPRAAVTEWLVTELSTMLARLAEEGMDPAPLDDRNVSEPVPVATRTETRDRPRPPEVGLRPDLNPLVQALATVVTLVTDYFQLDAHTPEHPEGIYVQGRLEEDGSLLLEVPSNEFFRPPLSLAQERHLSELGWESPEPDLPNFWRHISPDRIVPGEVAGFILRTLVEVYGVTDESEFTLTPADLAAVALPDYPNVEIVGTSLLGEQIPWRIETHSTPESQKDPVELPFTPSERVANVVHAAMAAGAVVHARQGQPWFGLKRDSESSIGVYVRRTGLTVLLSPDAAVAVLEGTGATIERKNSRTWYLRFSDETLDRPDATETVTRSALLALGMDPPPSDSLADREQLQRREDEPPQGLATTGEAGPQDLEQGGLAADEDVWLQPFTDSYGMTHGALLVTSHGAEYLWPDAESAWFGPERLEAFTRMADPRLLNNPTAWFRVATIGISVEFLANAAAMLHSSRAAAAEHARQLFAANEEASLTLEREAADTWSRPAEAEGSVESRRREAMDDFAAAGGDPDDPQQVMSLVVDMLGPIDPDGPNGWLLKAAAGEPYDKSTAWIHWD